MIKKILKFLIPILIIGIGLVIAVTLISTPKEAAKIELKERITPVEILRISRSSERVIVLAQGTVRPAKQIVIVPQVNGQIVYLNSELVPGGVFRTGQTLARIDPRDYQLAIEAQKERIASAEYGLKMEQGQQAVARQEWELLSDTVPTTAEGRELALRIPQINKAEASLKAAKSALENSKLALSRTEIRASFNCVVLSENVDKGQVVGPQSQIAVLAGTDQFWVQVSIPVEDLVWITLPSRSSEKGSMVKILNANGSQNSFHQGFVYRLLSDLDQAGRLARLLIAVNDPLLLKDKEESTDRMPLLLGSYVTVEIDGKMLDNVFVVPRKALRDVEEEVAGAGTALEYSWVWLMDDEGRLRNRKVKVTWRLQDVVYITDGLSEGDQLILSNLSTPIQGMKISEQAPEER